MQSELDRSMENLVMDGHEKPYFISYRLVDIERQPIEASMGSLTDMNIYQSRRLTIDLRIGDYSFDNSGAKEKQWWELEAEDRKYQNLQMPIDEDTIALKHRLWLVTDHMYKKALEDYEKKKKDEALSAEEDDDKVPDFSREEPETYIGERVSLLIDRKAMEERVKDLSTIFTSYEDITVSRVRFEARASNVYFANTEGLQIQDGGILYSVEIEAHTRSVDGMTLSDNKKFYSNDGEFDYEMLEDEITGMAERLTEIRKAEVCEPYAGPVLIAAPASGAIVADILVPLLVADKKSWKEGGELKNRVGERVMSQAISVYDNPTIDSYNGQPLVGHYRFDDEGVAATKVDLISSGVLRNFLLSRSPVKGFEKSNGHGRGEGNIGNLIVSSSSPLSFSQLKSKLVTECRNQGKSYGYLVTTSAQLSGRVSYVRVITISSGSGGSHRGPSQLRPVEVYKIYTDGRQVLVRGMEVLAGRPLSMLSKIEALGADHKAWSVNNGTGSIVAPSILLSELEVRKATGGEQTLPILPAPGGAVD